MARIKALLIYVRSKNCRPNDSFKKMRSTLTLNGSCTEEIRSRISMCKRAFEKVKKALLTARTILIQMRKRVAKCFIWSVVLYGNETWTIKA